MIQDTISQIEQRLATMDTVTPKARRELINLLDTLQAEISALPQDQAKNVRVIAEPPASERLSGSTDPEMISSAVNRLRQSVESFENTHPVTVEAINRIANTLSGMGI